MSKSKTIAALEIGTGKMQVFLGEIVDGKILNIVGSGQATTAGVKKADICDVVKAAAQAQAAIVMAERSTATQIKSVCLGISGTHIRGFRNTGSANVSGADAIVRKEDLERAAEDARGKSLPEGRAFIQKICGGYYLDGKFCADPIGKRAEHIDVDYWMIHGDREKIADAIHVVNSFGIDVEHLVFSGIASGYTVLDKSQKENGALVVDIGCGTSDYAFFAHGKPVFAGVVPIGGDHITNDLSFGLQLNRKDSERIKIHCGKATITADEKSQKFWNQGDRQIGDKKIPLEAINQVIRARLEELFSILRDECREYMPEECEMREAVLTGGTSRLAGICGLAEGILEVPCSMGKFPSALQPGLRYQEYATALGLLEYARREEEKSGPKKSSWFSNIFNF
ncbi:MAG: cell division protein FtsA [Opitutales bacterium]|nr:cell division protein FtsA [Opitutales bacterium]